MIGRSFSDAVIQKEKLATREKWLKLLEDIANQLQEIKETAEARRHLHCASPTN
uniref:Uncharacterized protein n=1 Tax=Arundo donax TaxID=35708 RepID=A0A0A9C8W0_ARUDO